MGSTPIASTNKTYGCVTVSTESNGFMQFMPGAVAHDTGHRTTGAEPEMELPLAA